MYRRGFTLIEMAVVMVIIGLIFTGATTIATPVFNSEKTDLTERRLTAIQQALQVYVIQYGCLPCPASGTADSTVSAQNPGVSLTSGSTTYVTSSVHCTASACLTTAGVVPWITLGLSEDDAVDGWSHRIGYVVAASGTGCSGAASLQNTNAMVRCAVGASPAYPVGNLNIYSNDTAAVELSSAAYALVSAGADGTLTYAKTSGAYTGDRYSQASQTGTAGQGMNYGGSNARTYGSQNATTGTSHFDDIARFMSAPVMIQKCGANACGNPA